MVVIVAAFIPLLNLLFFDYALSSIASSSSNPISGIIVKSFQCNLVTVFAFNESSRL